MNTAPVNTVINDQGALSRDMVVNGVTLTAGMTAEHRFAAIAKANVSTQFHTDSTAALFAQKDGPVPGSIAGKAPPPPPAALERSNAMPPQGNPSPARQVDLDREQQDAGIQTRPDGRRIAVGQRDDEAIDLLTANYRILALANRDNPAAAARFKAAYENDLKSLLDGKQLSGAQIQELRKRAGRGDIESFVPKSKEPAAPALQAPPAVPGWQSHIEDGQWVGLEHLTLDDTHGFTIPRFVDNQRVHTSTFELLKQAKAAGISQAQVNAVLTQQARNNGWVRT
jgi:hypothetical protein